MALEKLLQLGQARSRSSEGVPREKAADLVVKADIVRRQLAHVAKKREALRLSDVTKFYFFDDRLDILSYLSAIKNSDLLPVPRGIELILVHHDHVDAVSGKEERAFMTDYSNTHKYTTVTDCPRELSQHQVQAIAETLTYYSTPQQSTSASPRAAPETNYSSENFATSAGGAAAASLLCQEEPTMPGSLVESDNEMGECPQEGWYAGFVDSQELNALGTVFDGDFEMNFDGF